MTIVLSSFFLSFLISLSHSSSLTSPCHVSSVSLPPVCLSLLPSLSPAFFLSSYSFSIPRFRFLFSSYFPVAFLLHLSLHLPLSLPSLFTTSSSSPISLLLSLPPVLFDVSPCFLSFVKSSFLSHLVFFVLSCFKSQPAHSGVSESRYWRKRLNSTR